MLGGRSEKSSGGACIIRGTHSSQNHARSGDCFFSGVGAQGSHRTKRKSLRCRTFRSDVQHVIKTDVDRHYRATLPEQPRGVEPGTANFPLESHNIRITNSPGRPDRSSESSFPRHGTKTCYLIQGQLPHRQIIHSDQFGYGTRFPVHDVWAVE